MSFGMILTIAMMVIIVILIVTNASHPGIIMAGVPIVIAIILGISQGVPLVAKSGPSVFKNVQSWINQGSNMIVGTLVLMIFAILFFSMLHELGVFKYLVNKILGVLKNSVVGVMIATVFIAILTQLDGSGSTTALCTIPPLKPVYEKMKIRVQALLFLECLTSGIWIFLPWAPALNETSAYLKGAGFEVEAYDIFKWAIPLAIFSTVLLILLCIPLAIIEKKKGAGMTNEEYAALREEITKPVELPYGKGKAIFAGIFTIVIMLLILFGILPSAVTFIIGYIVLALLVYKKPKDIADYIRRQAPMIFNLTMTMLGVAVLVGVLNGMGTMKEFADMIAASSGGALKHIPWICACFSLVLSFITGGAKMSVVIPAVAAIGASFGISPAAVAGAIIICGSAGAGLNPFSGSSYLGLNLAGLEMGQHLKYSLLPTFIFGIIQAVFCGVTGLLPF